MQEDIYDLWVVFLIGVPTNESLASRIGGERGLEMDEGSFIVLGYIGTMWTTTSNKEAATKKPPLEIGNTGLLFYVEISCGELNLKKLHDRPLIITPEMDIFDFRNSLHPYIAFGMERAVKIIK